MRLAAVWLPAWDWERAKDFYGRVLALKEDARDDDAGWAAYSTDGAPPIVVMRRPDQRIDAPTIGFTCLELEALQQRLSDSGAQVEVKRREGSEIRGLAFVDPDGHFLEAWKREFRLPAKPVAVGAVVTGSPDHVLLVRPSYRKGRWDLPGRLLEDNEGPAEALQRELAEEVGVRPLEPCLTGLYHTLSRDTLQLVFRCRLDGQPRPDGREIKACDCVHVREVERHTTPWVMDRVLDALEFSGQVAMRVQIMDASGRKLPARSRTLSG